VWIFNGVCLTWPPCCNSDHQSTHKEIALEIQLILSLRGQNTQNPTAKGQLTANHTTSQGSIDNAQLLFLLWSGIYGAILCALVGNLWCFSGGVLPVVVKDFIYVFCFGALRGVKLCPFF